MPTVTWAQKYTSQAGVQIGLQTYDDAALIVVWVVDASTFLNSGASVVLRIAMLTSVQMFATTTVAMIAKIGSDAP